MPTRAIIFFALALPLAAAHPPVDIWGARAGLSFEANRGQTDPAVRYLARTGDGIILFTDAGVILPGRTAAARFQIAGEGPAARWEPLDATGRTTTYRVGRDRSHWVDDAPSYRSLARRNAYPGIDVVYYGAADRLEYDFRLAPHADPAAIRLRFTGARRLRIASDGALIVETAEGEVRHQKPVAYETLPDGSRREVQSAYRLLDARDVAFSVGVHDPALPLAIDPVLDASTFLGGSGDDSVIAAGADVVVGNTSSLDFPGASFGRRKANCIFVQQGSFTTIYGATGDAIVTSAALSGVGTGYVSLIAIGGYTNATDLPTTTNGAFTYTAWQSEYSGGATDGFLLLIYPTSSRNNTFLSYVGTSGDDRITAVSASGTNFAVAGVTTGRGLPSGDAPVFQGVPSDSAAGVDGFFIAGFNIFPEVRITATVYFGGSGDDTPSSILLSNPNVYVSGETNSPDFSLPGGPSPLNGPSDAFLMLFPSYRSAPASAGVLFGGSGAERGTALCRTVTSILLAGTTSSTDLPTRNAAQPNYGGGASDGFLAVFATDLSSVTLATYIGGSGAEQPSSVATDFGTGIFVAGWTSSPDFPVVNPLQANFGGGADDGFVSHYDLNGSLLDATYFGGSGSDRILGLQAFGGSAITVWGQTSSADLPLQNPTQTALKGSSDGFIARFGSAAINALPAFGGKDLRTYGSAYIGEAAASPVSITLTSSDPSIVQIAANPTDSGQSSIQLSGTYPNGFIYYLDCLADHGGATITISAPGYATQIVPAQCYPAAVSVSYSGRTVTSSANSPAPLTLALSGATSFAFQLAVFPPNGGPYYAQSLRPGVGPLMFQIATSNPSVGSFDSNTATFASSADSSVSAVRTNFTPAAAGETFVTFSSDTLAFPYNPLDVIVSSLSGLNPTYSVPAGFQRAIQLSYLPLDPKQTVTITTQDPSSVLLSTTTSQAGAASISYNASGSFVQNFYVQAIASSGDVPVTVAAPGEAPVNVNIHIVAPALTFPYAASLPQPITLALGQSIALTAGVGTSDVSAVCCFVPNPGGTLSLTLTSSNPQAVSIATPTVVAANGSASFSIKGESAGSSVLSVRTPPGFAESASNRTPAVLVKTKPAIMADIEVGNNLTALMTLTLPVAATSQTAVHLASSNPGLVLLSPTINQTAGAAQIDLSLAAGATTAQFYVYGLAPAGQARITATVSGGVTVTATVTLDPSGFLWAADSTTATLYSSFNLPSITSYALDPATMLPVAAQTLRPGLTASVGITNANPDIVSLSTPSYTVPNGFSLQIKSVAAGTATLTLVQPAGFSLPALRQNLAVVIKTPTIVMNTITIGKNLQAPIQFGGFGSPDLPLTVTSSDPGKLLISADPSQPGAASVTVNQAGISRLTVQALDDQGAATITASMPTFNPGTLTVAMAPTAIGLNASGDSVPVPQQTGQFTTTTQSPPTTITPQILILSGSTPQPTGLALRAGLGPVQFDIVSSNPSVGAISGSPITLSAGQYAQQPTVAFTPQTEGQTTVSVVTPAGFTAAPGLSSLSVNVTGPTFLTYNVLLGKDTALSTSISLPNNVAAPRANVAVTLTSSDPSRVLLSPDAATPPSAAITQIMIAGHNGAGPFYIHALDNNGVVPISVAASGYAPGTLNIALADLSFAFNYFGSTQVLLQSGAQTANVVPVIVIPRNPPVGYGLYQPVIRPGASIPVSVTSSDAGTIGVDTPQLVFSGGSSQVAAKFHAVQTGAATLTLGVPSGYSSPASTGQIALTVAGAQLGFAGVSSALVGRDLQTSLTISSQGFPPNAITVTSSDPSHLLLSTDGVAPGQGSITVTPAASGFAGVYLQGLADSGTSTVTVSAPSYVSASLTVTHTSSAAVFSNVNSTNTQLSMQTNTPVQPLTVNLSPLDPATLQPRGTQLPRPGANLSVTLTSSNPAVLAVSTPAIAFLQPDPAKPVTFTASVQPLSAGTAVLTLGPLANGGTPASGGAVVVNVTEPNLSIPFFTIGRDLEGPIQAKLGASAPLPVSDLTVAVNAFYPLLTSTSPTGPMFNTVTVTIPAGQRTSTPFYIAGNAIGAASVYLYAGNYNWNAQANVTQTAFVFKEAAQSQSVAVNAGSTGSLTVVPALSPPATSALGPLMIGGGVAPIPITVTSSNPAVLAVVNSQTFLNPGDRQVTVSVKGFAPGQATVTLSGATYDFTLPESRIAVTVK
ncbi:MAG TPA: hypothetical protein VN736_04410 [Candidatus Limnocylindrales bacterium]|nr:hypothetical protein [Candidatus Limnocylindrales bacterium]